MSDREHEESLSRPGICHVDREPWPCEVIRLREALAYYADPNYYCCQPWAEEHNGMPESESDMGRRARQVLGLPEPWPVPAAVEQEPRA